MRHIVSFLLKITLITALLFPSFHISVFAADSENHQYKPVDVVLVIDTSGSMTMSDSNRLVLQAGRTFANMMPSIDSRLGVVGFSDKAVTYTSREGEPVFFEMGELENVLDVHNIFSEVEYGGDTGIGFGLSKAVELFETNPRADVNKAILVFSDGVDDLPSKVQYQEAQEKLADSVTWAAENKCPIYTVGFNYRNNDGKDSLGGEGMEKLQYISDTTHASVTEVNDIKDIEQAFSNILATICGVQIDNIDTVPGDGQRHEIPIKVSAGVVEMNIRIACNTKEAIRTGKIELKDNDKKDVALNNNGNVRFDVEQTSANIKVIAPSNGTWTLILNGIKGDDITIGLLNHFQIGLQLTCNLPKGNPSNTAYNGDTVTLVVKLIDGTGKEAPEAYYKDIVSAVAEIQSRADGAKPENVKLVYKNGALQGDFKADGKAAYDIKATVATQYYTKKGSLIITNGNKPLELTGAAIPNQIVKVKKTISIPDIYSYVTDAEGDEIHAEIVDLSNPDAASVTIEGNAIDISGLKWGSTVVRVRYTDVQKNTVEQTFSIKVKDPVKVILLSMVPVIIGLVILGCVILALLKTRRIPGVFSVGPVSTKGSDRIVTIGRPTRIPARIACRGGKTKLFALIRTYVNMTQNLPYITPEQASMLLKTFMMSRDEVFNVLNSIELKGTVLGKKGFVLSIPQGLPVKLNSCKEGDAVKVNVMGRNQMTFLIKKLDGTEVKIGVVYEQNATK